MFGDRAPPSDEAGTEVDGRRAPEAQGGWALEWRQGTRARRLELADRTVIGSSERADLVLEDPLVSRLHCELVVRDDGVWVKDLDSTNGTAIHGVRCIEARLPPGGRLAV